MKVISTQKDFYDGASGYYSADFVWRRETEIRKNVFIYDLPSDLVEWLKSLSHRLYYNGKDGFGRNTYGCSGHYILFVAGKAYPLFSNCDLIEWQSPGFVRGIESDPNDFLIYADSTGIIGKDISLRDEAFKWDRKPETASTVLKQFLAVEGSRVGDALHIQFESPVILLKLDRHFYPKSRHDIVVNPNLSVLLFQKKMDAFATHQEIEQYMTNVLTPVDKSAITVGDDVVIARQKGFDDQSFRTHAPGAKKENRKENRLRKKHKV